MMKMNGRDSAECQNWEKNDIDVIIEIDLNEEKDKIVNSGPLPLSKGRKRGKDERKKGEMTEGLISFSRERVSSIFLGF